MTKAALGKGRKQEQTKDWTSCCTNPCMQISCSAGHLVPIHQARGRSQMHIMQVPFLLPAPSTHDLLFWSSKAHGARISHVDPPPRPKHWLVRWPPDGVLDGSLSQLTNPPKTAPAEAHRARRRPHDLHCGIVLYHLPIHDLHLPVRMQLV